MPNQPEVEIERDSGMRAYEITISREGAPVTSVIVGDRGHILVFVAEEGKEHQPHSQETLELGRTYCFEPPLGGGGHYN